MSNKTKCLIWLAINTVGTFGMGYNGTRTLSALLISLIFAVIYIVSVIPVIYFGIKWAKEN
jgi:hypothetical protein